MKRPADAEDNLERIRKWRQLCPDLAIRSTFIVGFPGETEQDFEQLLAFLQEADLDRVGCFEYSAVKGAAANQLPGAVSEEIKQERRARLMVLQEEISRRKLKKKVGTVLTVLVEKVNGASAVARSSADAPEIDGVVRVQGAGLQVGEFARVKIKGSDAHDLRGKAVQ
jgi:ribosomal protein S12 methylthiotransferase